MPTTVSRRCSVKKVFLKYFSQNSQENTCAGVCFWWSCRIEVCIFIEKETLAPVFFCEFREIFKNTFFYNTSSGCVWNANLKYPPPNDHNHLIGILLLIGLNTPDERNKIIYQSIHGYVMTENDDITTHFLLLTKFCSVLILYLDCNTRFLKILVTVTYSKTPNHGH